MQDVLDRRLRHTQRQIPMSKILLWTTLTRQPYAFNILSWCQRSSGLSHFPTLPLSLNCLKQSRIALPLGWSTPHVGRKVPCIITMCLFSTNKTTHWSSSCTLAIGRNEGRRNWKRIVHTHRLRAKVCACEFAKTLWANGHVTGNFMTLSLFS